MRCALLNDWGGQPLPLNASRWLDGTARPALCCACAARWPRSRRPARTWAASASDAAQAAPTGQALRDQRRCLVRAHARGGATLWRLSVPQTAPVLALAGDAADRMAWRQRWYCAPRRRRRRSCARPPRAAGGHATLFCRRPSGQRGSARFDAAEPAARAHPPRAEARVRPARHLQSRPALSRTLTTTARMQTELAPEFQGTADGHEAEAILRKCVHCGFCTATCPTYQLLGDELDGPRGRIYLIKQVLEGEAPTRSDAAAPGPLPDLPQLREHLPARRAVRPPGRHRPQDRRRARCRAPRRRSALRWALKEGLTSPLFAPAMKLGQSVRGLLPAALKAKVPAPAGARARLAHAHARAQGAAAGRLRAAVDGAQHQQRHRARARRRRHPDAGRRRAPAAAARSSST